MQQQLTLQQQDCIHRRSLDNPAGDSGIIAGRNCLHKKPPADITYDESFIVEYPPVKVGVTLGR